MARVEFVDIPSLPSPLRERVAGHPISIAKTLAHVGDGYLAFATLSEWIRFGTKLDGRDRELAILGVGLVNRSAYEVAHHIKIGRDFGLSDADIAGAIAFIAGREHDLTDDDQLVLRATREITADGAISSASWDALLARWGQEILIEFTLIVAHYNGVTRLLGSLEIDIEPEYQGYLPEFSVKFD